MATRTETRPMSPFARARASAGADVTADLRATITKVDELIRTEQAHNNALRELITGLETRIQADLSGVRRSVTTLEARVAALEGQNRTLTTRLTEALTIAREALQFAQHHHHRYNTGMDWHTTKGYLAPLHLGVYDY